MLDSSNAQHRRVLAAVRRHDEAAAAREMAEHLRGTEHVLAGLLPKVADRRLAVNLASLDFRLAARAYRFAAKDGPSDLLLEEGPDVDQ